MSTRQWLRLFVRRQVCGTRPSGPALIRSCFLLLLAANSAGVVSAGIRPSFSLDQESWDATDIVVVKTTTDDATFEVVQPLKGGCIAGEKVFVPELRPEADALPISEYPTDYVGLLQNSLSTKIPRVSLGSEIVLFLKRQAALASSGQRAHGIAWAPADLLGSMKASAVWIDGDRLRVFIQLVNPGPSELSELWQIDRANGKRKLEPMSEQSLKARVAEIVQIQEDVGAIVAITDPGERAIRLKPYVNGDINPARRLALQRLRECGVPALSTIRSMLDDASFQPELDDLLPIYAEIGRDTVADDLDKRLKVEVAFWEANGPVLKAGWRSQFGDTSTQAASREFRITHELLVGLQKTSFLPALNTATNLRVLWLSLPQLNDGIQVDEILQDCDELIRHLQSKPPTGY